MFPDSASRISASDGSGLSRSSAAVATMKPGVQKPHCTAPAATNARCMGCRWSPSAAPSQPEARAHQLPIHQDRARPALALFACVLAAPEPEPFPQHGQQAFVLARLGF